MDQILQTARPASNGSDDTLRIPTRIPKRIIHIYCPPPGATGELPLVCRAALANARLLNPDFDHVLFGTDEMEKFIDHEFPQYRKVIDSFPYRIQRFDFFRYLAVYRLGGFYFDLDVFLARRLEPLLGESCVFSFEELTLSGYLRRNCGMDWELANYGFGAAPGHPFIGAVIANCVRAIDEPRWAEEMMQGIPKCFRAPFIVPVSTGPGMVTRTFVESPNISPSVTVLFPSNVCDERSWQQFGDFGVHLMQGSWRKRDSFFVSRLRRLWETRARKKLMQASVVKGPRRSGPWREILPQNCTTNSP